MTPVARGASLLFSGLFAGFLVCVLVLENSLRAYNGSIYTQMRLVELDSLDKLASATLLPAIVTTVVLAIMAPRRERWLILTAVALLAVVFATTLAINLPINSDQTSWAVQHPPADWAEVRDRWQLAHVIRTAAALFAFGLLVGSAVRQRVPSRLMMRSWETA